MFLAISCVAVLLQGPPPFLPPGFPLPLPAVAPRTVNPNATVDHALGASLLALPPGTPLGPLEGDMRFVVAESVTRVGVEWGVRDDTEATFVYLTPEAMQGELDEMRSRVADLADAPPAYDSLRLPPGRSVQSMIDFNRAFRKNIEARMQLESDRQRFYQLVLDETDDCHEVLSEMRIATGAYYTYYQRTALKRLRDLVGKADYEQGRWPPCVPTWRFNTIK
jgi:hypothetical protein